MSSAKLTSAPDIGGRTVANAFIFFLYYVLAFLIGRATRDMKCF